MATFNYQEILDIADELVAEFGRPAALKRKVNGGTATRGCTVCEVTDMSTERDGSQIQYADRQFLIAAGGLNPGPDAEEDKLLLDGKEFRITSVKRIQPASLNVLWDCQVRL